MAYDTNFIYICDKSLIYLGKNIDVDPKTIKFTKLSFLKTCEESCNRAVHRYFAALSMTKQAGSTAILSLLNRVTSCASSTVFNYFNIN